MTKAILIMDMPETCGRENCPLCVIDVEMGEVVCARTKASVERYYTQGKPDWCPLIPVRGYVTPEGHLVSWEDGDKDD